MCIRDSTHTDTHTHTHTKSLFGAIVDSSFAKLVYLDIMDSAGFTEILINTILSSAM